MTNPTQAYIPEEMVIHMRNTLFRNKIKQKDFAEMMGVSCGYVSGVLTGKKPPNKKMQEYFGIKTGTYIKWELL